MRQVKYVFTRSERQEVVYIIGYEAIDAVLELQATSGSNAKKAVIQKYSGDHGFELLLYYILNPMLTYKVSEQTLREAMCKQYTQSVDPDWMYLFDICENLASRRAVDYDTISKVALFLFDIPERYTDFCIKLLSKTLRLGVTSKTVNKVIPGLIPEWEVQQAYPIEKYPLKPGTEFWLTQKLNGTRATYYKGRLYARSGVPYDGLGHIEKILDAAVGDRYVVDGELTLYEKDGINDNEAFRIATGIINSDAEEKRQICYTVFDMVETDEFDGESSTPYNDRELLISKTFTESERYHVRRTPILYHGTDQTMIDKFLAQMVSDDKEGLMVNLNVPYQRKRHNGILKVKRFYTMDLPIIGVEEGSGRLAGMLGAFVLDYKGNEVRVGSGFSDKQRTDFWAVREELTGTICEVKYKEISYDKKTGAESLQFPVFVGLRHDKYDVSYG